MNRSFPFFPISIDWLLVGQPSGLIYPVVEMNLTGSDAVPMKLAASLMV
jgi:hypothetical protein